MVGKYQNKSKERKVKTIALVAASKDSEILPYVAKSIL